MIDIILCCYNSEQYIEKCIWSILNQTFKDFKLYIFDDKSTDKTVEIIDSINDDRIFLVKSKKNIGTYAGKNHILKNYCKNKYICLHDADDMSLPTRLEEQIDFIKKLKKEKNNWSCIGSCVIEKFINHIPTHITSKNKIKNNERINTYPLKISKELLVELYDLLDNDINKYYKKAKICMNGTCMFKRETLLKVNGWDDNTRIGGDTDIFCRLLKYGNIYNIQKPLYIRTFHENSLTSSKELGIGSTIRDTYNKTIIKNSIKKTLES